MPVELEINELPNALSVSGTNILHSKGLGDGDVKFTVQEILDLVPATDFTTFVPATEGTINTGNDYVAFSDASASGEVRRVTVANFISALALPAISGSVTSGHYQIGDLQIRWGETTMPTDTETITFAAPYTNECFGVWVNYANGGSNYYTAVTSKTQTNFIVDKNSSTTNGLDLQYISIGR